MAAAIASGLNTGDRFVQFIGPPFRETTTASAPGRMMWLTPTTAGTPWRSLLPRLDVPREGMTPAPFTFCIKIAGYK